MELTRHYHKSSRYSRKKQKETLLGKVLLKLGVFGDGTNFGEQSIKTIGNLLRKLGMQKQGSFV